jgi:hypothetical protein
MKRTQLYLEEEMWKVLEIQSRQTGVTVSALVRQAVREKFQGGKAARREAMQALVGLWRDRADLPSTEQYIRELRKGRRIERLSR